MSLFQQPVYRASARMLFTPQNGDGPGGQVSAANDRTQAATLAGLIRSAPVVDEASRRIGLSISPKQIGAGQVETSRIIEVAVVSAKPENAARAANALVEVFITQQEERRSSLYAEEEVSLKNQINQVEAQIDALQNKAYEEAQQLHTVQVAGLRQEIAGLEDEIRTLQEDLVLLEYGGTPVPGFDASWRRVMIQPTLTVDQQIDRALKSNRLAEAQRMLENYRNLYLDFIYREQPADGAAGTGAPTALTLDQYERIYASLLNNYEAIRLARMRSAPNLTMVDYAIPPEVPIRPNILTNILVGAVLGLLIGSGVSFIRLFTDETIRSADEARILLRLPVLASFPRDWGKSGLPGSQSRLINYGSSAPGSSGLAVMKPDQPAMLALIGSTEPESQNIMAVEGLRFLQSNLEYISSTRNLHTVLISSPSDSPSSAWLAYGLAQVSAHLRRPVLLIDANFRRKPGQKTAVSEEPEGLSDVLSGSKRLHDVICRNHESCLSEIVPGKLAKDPNLLLNGPALRQFFLDLDDIPGLVVINGPPFAFAESIALASAVDGVVLSIELDRTRATVALAAMEQLDLVKADIVGMVLS